MGKGSTSSQQTQNSSEFTPELMSIFKSSVPTLRALSSQTTEALQTGGVNAQIPSINSSVAAARQAYSTSQQSLKNQLAQSGLANSSFGTAILGQNQEQAGQQIAAIPSQITNDFLQRGAPTVIGAGTGALTTAAGLNTQSNTQFTPGFWQMFTQGLGASSQGLGYGVGSYFGAGGTI